jgi:hypothetical protein
MYLTALADIDKATCCVVSVTSSRILNSLGSLQMMEQAVMASLTLKVGVVQICKGVFTNVIMSSIVDA